MKLSEQNTLADSHEFRNLTKLVSQFLNIYAILHRIYKFTLRAKLEKTLEIEKGRRQPIRSNSPGGSRGNGRACSRSAQQAARDGKPTRAPAHLQKNPQLHRISHDIMEHYYTREELCTKDPGTCHLHHRETPTLPRVC